MITQITPSMNYLIKTKSFSARSCSSPLKCTSAKDKKMVLRAFITSSLKVYRNAMPSRGKISSRTFNWLGEVHPSRRRLTAFRENFLRLTLSDWVRRWRSSQPMKKLKDRYPVGLEPPSWVQWKCLTSSSSRGRSTRNMEHHTYRKDYDLYRIING